MCPVRGEVQLTHVCADRSVRHLLDAQRLERIDVGGSSCRNPAREKRDAHDAHRHERGKAERAPWRFGAKRELAIAGLPCRRGGRAPAVKPGSEVRRA